MILTNLQSKEGNKKRTTSRIIFKQVQPEKGNYSRKLSFILDEKAPIKIFYNKLPVGLIILKPKVQIQIKGKKQEVKAKSLGEAKAWVLNNSHLIHD